MSGTEINDLKDTVAISNSLFEAGKRVPVKKDTKHLTPTYR